MTIVVPALRAAVAPAPWVKNELWRKAREVPSLDLRFAEDKSLVDATTGSNLVDFTRASSGTYVGSDGLIKTATTNLLTYSEEFDDAAWSNNTYITPDTVASPDGTTTADTLAISTAGVWLFQDVTISSGATVAFSVFAKEATTSWLVIRISTQDQSSYRDVWFDLSSGSIGTESGAGSEVATGIGSIKQFDNGFYRISGIFTTSGITTVRIRIATVDADSSFTRAGSVYIWGAQLEQSSTVGEYVKTTSTINSAPRFDHDPTTGESLGLLVEESRVNYCLQSEAFGTSPWSASNVTVTADQAIAPDGVTTADELEATSSNGTVTQSVTTTAIDMTFSVYLKRKTGTGNIDITADGSTWVTQTISDTAWTRCVVTQTAVAGTSNPGIRIVTSGDEVYAWGGQYE